MRLYGASGLRTHLCQSIMHDKGPSMTGSRRQLSRPIARGEVLGFMATGHPGTQVPQKIGTVEGSPSEHASLKILAGSKSSWILQPTIETLRDSPDFWGPEGCSACPSPRVYGKTASAVSWHRSSSFAEGYSSPCVPETRRAAKPGRYILSR